MNLTEHCDRGCWKNHFCHLHDPICVFLCTNLINAVDGQFLFYLVYTAVKLYIPGRVQRNFYTYAFLALIQPTQLVADSYSISYLQL